MISRCRKHNDDESHQAPFISFADGNRLNHTIYSFARELDYLPILLDLGFTRLSVNLGSIVTIMRQMRTLDWGLWGRLAGAALRLITTQEVERLMADSMATESAVK